MVHFAGKTMIERGFAVFVLGFVFAGYNGHIHHPAAAFLAKPGRLLDAMPQTTIVHGKIACIEIETNFAIVIIIIDEIFFAEQ